MCTHTHRQIDEGGCEVHDYLKRAAGVVVGQSHVDIAPGPLLGNLLPQTRHRHQQQTQSRLAMWVNDMSVPLDTLSANGQPDK